MGRQAVSSSNVTSVTKETITEIKKEELFQNQCSMLLTFADSIIGILNVTQNIQLQT